MTNGRDSDLSTRINQYMREKDNPPIKNLELSINNEFNEFEKAYAKISNDLEKLDRESEKYGQYTNKKIDEKYARANLKAGFEGWGIKKIKKDIIGKEVIDINGQLIGKVKDVEVSLETRKFESLIIGKEGFLESIASKNEIVIPYNMIHAIKDRILLKGEKKL